MDIGQDLRNIALATSILASLNNNLTHQQKVQRCILHHCQSKQNQADAYRVAKRRAESTTILIIMQKSVE